MSLACWRSGAADKQVCGVDSGELVWVNLQAPSLGSKSSKKLLSKE
jgi:hypothetical protein